MTIQETGIQLQKLLCTLKKNRENVPIQILKSQYKTAYEDMVQKVNQTASDFVKLIITDQLPLNPHADIEEQIDIINHTIASSGMPERMSQCISTEHDTYQLYLLALELRQMIDLALSFK